MSAARIFAAIAALSLALRPAGAHAQCATCGIAILHLDAGARPAGFGGAYYSGDGPSAAFYNPAQVGSSAGVTLNLSPIAGATLGEFAVTGRLNGWGLGASARALSGGAPSGDADSSHLAGGAFVAGLSVARSVHGLRLGATAKLVAPELNAAGVAAFDAGAAIRHFGLEFGLVVQDLGADVVAAGVRQPLPTRVSLGAALADQSISTYFDLSASAGLTRERGGELVPKGGLELDYVPVSGWQFAGRIGVRRVVPLPGVLRESAVTLGGSITVDNLSIDYAFSPGAGGGTAIHSVGVRLQ